MPISNPIYRSQLIVFKRFLLLSFLVPACVLGADDQITVKTAAAVPANAPPVIDGVLDDAAWEHAADGGGATEGVDWQRAVGGLVLPGVFA